MPPGSVNTFLVPYRALARELFTTVLERGRAERPDAVIKVATGDHSDPETDRNNTDGPVATYEKSDSLLRDEPKFQPYLVVANEIHHLGDRIPEFRGHNT